MEGDYQGQRHTTCFLLKESVKPSDIRRRLSAICGEKAPARSIVLNWVRSFKCGKKIAQAAVQGWYLNLPTGRFRAAIQRDRSDV